MSKQQSWTLDIVGGVCARLLRNPFVLALGNNQLNLTTLAPKGK